MPENSTYAQTRDRQLFKIIGKSVLCSVLTSCGAMLFACGWSPETPPRGPSATDYGDSAERVLTRGLLGEPRTLDPHLADDTFSLQVVRDLYEGLTAEAVDGQIVPGVASSWTIDSTGKIYTFRLRQDAKWSNGEPIVALDFVNGLRHAVDPHTASGVATALNPIKGAREITAGIKNPGDLGVTAIDDSLLEIRLERPAPFILELLSQPVAAPIYIQRTNRPNLPAKSPTNGPYILVNRVPGSMIDLKKNSLYWDAAHVAIQRIRYMNSESESTESREYAAGQIDITFTIPLSDVERLTKEYGNQVQTAPILATLYLALDLTELPFKNNRDLRQALSMAVDRELISAHVMAGVTPAYSFVAKGITGYAPPNYSWSFWARERQLQQAKDVFAQYGYSSKNPLRLKLYFNRDEGIQRLMVAIAGSWKQNLGVESELISDEFRVFLAGRKDRSRWDVTRLGWTADYNDPTSFLDVFAHSSNENDPGYVSNLYDEAIDTAENEPDDYKRAKLLQQAEQILLDDYPIIPIYFYTARRLVKPYVGGAKITPMNRTYSKHLFWKPG